MGELSGRVYASDKGAVRELIQGHSVVINGLSHEFSMNVVEAAIEAGAHGIDLNTGDREFQLDSQAKEAGVAYDKGCGATPGVTNLLAKHGAREMDAVEEIHISFAAFRAFGLSPALLWVRLWEFAPDEPDRTYYEDGKFHQVPPFAGERFIEFPEPIGRQAVYFVPHGETRTLPKNLGAKRVYTRGTFPPKVMRMVRSLLEYGFFREEPISIRGLMISPRELIMEYLREAPEAKEQDIWAYGLHVEMLGQRGTQRLKRTLWTTHPGMDRWGIPGAYAKNVGIPLAVGAELLARGEHSTPGVNAPEAFFEPPAFFEELKKRGIEVHESEEVLS
jgi:saccharopine dehydrogenase-like NADP-dependent oxidoreductase